MKHSILWPALFLVLLAACTEPTEPVVTPIATPTSKPVPAPTRESHPVAALNLALIYPGQDSELEMGTSTRLSVQITNADDEAVDDATVRFTLLDPEQRTIARLPAFHGSRGIYRTDSWTLPHRVVGGTWDVRVQAEAQLAEGACSGNFTVTDSTSEILLEKYVFWLAAPHLINAELQVGAERGDARNGMTRWGGAVPAMHITPANYVKVHWGEGKYSLESPAAVRRFMLEEIGNLGDVRTIGSIRPVRFKHWDSWRLECGTYTWEETAWVIFYAPQVDRTYAIATILRLPPKTPDPHGELRESFDVYPRIDATGVAPAPLPRLLPGPELVSPRLAARFRGLDQPVILQWEPVKELEADEYYRVTVDYTYREAWPVVHFTTRETQLLLPERLYHSPNCGLFNWRVTLMRQTGTGDDGQLIAEPASHPISTGTFGGYIPLDRSNSRRYAPTHTTIDRTTRHHQTGGEPMELRGLDIILTYDCSGRCAHCCYRAGPGLDGTMAVAEVEEYLTAVADQPLEGILLFGGEPFLTYDLLRASIPLAASLAQQVYVFTNGSWATDPDTARRRLAGLQDAGLDYILFSVDAFHQAHVPLERIAVGIEAARDLGYGTIHVDNRFLGEPQTDNPHNRRTRAYMARLAEHRDLSDITVYQGPARMVGRAADELSHLLPAQQIAADHCPLPDYLGGDLRDPTGIEIHPGGWVNFCAGLALGSAHRSPLDQILANYDPDESPIIRVLADRGPAGLLSLAQRHGYSPAEGYVDGCHLCYETRRFLRPYYPEQLAPAHPYLPG